MSHSGMTFFFQNLEQFKPHEIEAGKRIMALNNTEIIKWCNNYKYDFKTSPDPNLFSLRGKTILLIILNMRLKQSL